MSKSISQPVGQKRLTNVAVVRLQKDGHRFEIACYRNKVVNWRNRIETDLGEVLHRPVVFRDVGKGILASTGDLVESFGTENQEEICKEILDRGELQISDKERQAELSSLFRDIATIVSEKTVNPETNRPYTVSMITNAMSEIHYAVKPTKSAKQQALEVIRLLSDYMPIERAKMHLRMTWNASESTWTLIEQELTRVNATTLRKQEGAQSSIDFLLHPSEFRAVEEFVRSQVEGGRLDVVQLSVQEAGTADVDVELARREQRVAERSLKPEETKVSEMTIVEDVEQQEVDDGDTRTAAESTKKANKKSKLAKRLEKEAKKEREVQAEQLRNRRNKGQQQAQPQADQAAEPLAAATELTSRQEKATDGRSFTCNTCGGQFVNAAEHRAHFRSDWHRLNLKRKMKSMPLLTEADFGALSLEDIAAFDNEH